MDTRAADFIERHNLRGIVAIGRDWLLIGVAIGVSLKLDHWAVYVAAVWVIGCCQYALGEVLLHEASHYNLLKNRRLNDLMEVFYALPFFQTLKEYRRQHGLHHSHLGQRYHDHVVDDFHTFRLHEPRTSLWVAWFVKPLLGYPGFVYTKGLLVPDKSSQGTADYLDLRLAGFWLSVVSACWALGVLDLLFFYWIVPMYWVFCSLLFWSEVREHFRTRTGTRSTLGPIYNRFFHNQGYHALHHTYPTVPWYRLPRAFEALRHDRSRDVVGDLATGFFDVYRQIARPGAAV